MAQLKEQIFERVPVPWATSPEEIFKELNTSELGLTDKEAEKRIKKYGRNVFDSREKINPLSLFLKQFLSPLIFLLLAAAALTGILREWVDTIVIGLAVLLNVALGFYHEYQAENTLEKLTTYIKDRAKVIRAGVEQEIDSALLVPGDIIKLSYGSRVPADARLFDVNDLSADEAILTGESVPVNKNESELHVDTLVADRKNIAHAGTLVVQGYGRGVVYATSNHTEIGKIAGLVSETHRVETPLQKSVAKVAWIIFCIVAVIVVAILLLGLLRGEGLLPMLVLSSAVAVGAVPESLPIVLTLILAIGAGRIAERRGVIRKLNAAETLGSTTLIMTDKTGTLTMAEMQLVSVEETGEILSGDVAHKEFSEAKKNLLSLALLNSDISVENPADPESEWVFRGRPFEVNIAKACRAHGVSLGVLADGSTSLVLPFNSTNKFSVAERGDEYVVMGAPDILLSKSDISKEKYLKIMEFIDTMSRGGKRLIGIATVAKKHKKHFTLDDIVDLDFLGAFVFYDPIRPQVPDAIRNLTSQGVKVVLVTGDLVGTAIAVAKSLNWHVEESQVLTGKDIEVMSDEDLLLVLPKIKIFARVTPKDKLRIGELYRRLGEVVAMTGDGVNDAPSLKAMDIGVSLGSGSDVAKAASDLVLLDDNFETISMAVDEGRRILANIRKAFVYLMSNSLDEVFIIGGSLIAGISLPLTALQIVWVNLVTASLPSLAFAFDENFDKTKGVVQQSHPIFTRKVKTLILGLGIFRSLLLFLIYYALVQTSLDLSVIHSVFFVCFSSYILVIGFAIRSLDHSIFSYPVFSNHKLNAGILIGILTLLATMIIPQMREIFDLSLFPLWWLPLIVLWIALNVFLMEFTKYILRRS